MGEVIPIDELKVGGIYELVITPFRNDITRYRMMDLLKCIAKGDNILGTDLSVFIFAGRVGGAISLYNFTRIDEAELLTALNQASIPFVDFTATHDVEESGEYLTLHIEVKGEVNADEICSAVNEQLCKLDKDYLGLTKLYQQIPLRVKLLPPGTFNEYLKIRPGILKPERLGMKPEMFQKLMTIKDRLLREAS